MVWALVKALLTTSAGRASLRPKCSVQEGKVAGNQGGGDSWSAPLPCRKPVSAGKSKSVFCFQCVVVTSDKIAGKGKRKRKWLMLQNWVIYPFLSRSFIYFTCGKNQPLVLQFSFLFLPHSLWIHQLERLAVSQEPDLSAKSLPDVQSHKHVNHWQEPNDKLLPVRYWWLLFLGSETSSRPAQKSLKAVFLQGGFLLSSPRTICSHLPNGESQEPGVKGLSQAQDAMEFSLPASKPGPFLSACPKTCHGFLNLLQYIKLHTILLWVHFDQSVIATLDLHETPKLITSSGGMFPD